MKDSILEQDPVPISRFLNNIRNILYNRIWNGIIRISISWNLNGLGKKQNKSKIYKSITNIKNI